MGAAGQWDPLVSDARTEGMLWPEISGDDDDTYVLPVISCTQ